MQSFSRFFSAGLAGGAYKKRHCRAAPEFGVDVRCLTLAVERLRMKPRSRAKNA
jgi:hypothetical protein